MKPPTLGTIPTHKTSRRALLLGSAGAACVPLLGGCQAIGVALANPAVQGWLSALSANLGAQVLTDFSTKGIDATVNEWSTGFWELYHLWFPEAGDNGCVSAYAYRSEANPTFLLAATYSQSLAGTRCNEAEGDPLNDGCGVVIDTGQDGFHMPSWAWQTLAMFCSESLRWKTGKDLNRQKALLRVALAPVSSHADSQVSWTGAVAYLSYQTHMGPVDIAKIEKPDHSFKGMIKVSGFPDKVDEGTVWEYSLPTQVG